MNQNKGLVAFTSKHDHKDNYKEIFEKIVIEKLDEIEELTDEINPNYLIYYFKGNTFRKRSDDFNNGIELFKTIKSGETKLEEAKKLQNVFKSDLNEILRGRYKTEEQKSALKILNVFTNHEKLLLNYLMIIL